MWQDDVRPGGTLFYKVPVDWGQQLSVTAELGGSDGGSGYVTRALDLALYNPVRGSVDEAGLGYRGSARSVALEPLPPVEYRNRYSVVDHVNGMRFAGSYYLVVHLSTELADSFGQGPLPVTLRVRVGGSAHAGPGYAAKPEPRNIFEVTTQDRAAAVTGAPGRWRPLDEGPRGGRDRCGQRAVGEPRRVDGVGAAAGRGPGPESGSGFDCGALVDPAASAARTAHTVPHCSDAGQCPEPHRVAGQREQQDRDRHFRGRPGPAPCPPAAVLRNRRRGGWNLRDLSGV